MSSNSSKPCQLGISVGHVGHFSGGVAQRADHVAEGQEATVDGDALLGPVARGSGPLQPLRPGQVNKVELGGQGFNLGGRSGGRRSC